AAQAGPVPVILVTGAGCPSATALAAVLQRLVPEARIESTALGPGTPAAVPGIPSLLVRVTELADGYEVLAGRESRWLDADRDCSERARTAGLWVAMRLRLWWPFSSAPEEATPPSSPSPLPSPPAAPPGQPSRPPGRWRLRFDLELAGILEVAPTHG